MALPRNGLRGVEKMADTTAWTNSMAESGGARVKGHVKDMYASLYVIFPVGGDGNKLDDIRSHRSFF